MQNGDFPGNWFESMEGRIRSMACNVEQNNNTSVIQDFELLCFADQQGRGNF